MTFSKCPTQKRTTNAAENLVQFSAALASAASNPTTALTARLLFDRGMVFTAATFRASCPLVSDSLLSRFRATGMVRTTRAPLVRVVVTRVAFCGTKCRTFGSPWFRLVPKHDPPFPLRDLPGSRWQVRAEARRSLTLVRGQRATLRSRTGYNHQRRLPIDVDAGT